MRAASGSLKRFGLDFRCEGKTRCYGVATQSTRFYSRTPFSPFADPNRIELRADVKRLGKVLGNIIAQEDEKVFAYVESLRNLGKDFRRNDSKTAFDEMVEKAKSMTALEAKGVARAYAHFLALSNCAETHHRVRELDELRQLKHDTVSAFPSREDSCRGAISALLNDEGLSPQEVRNTLLKQRVELVLTA
eukprot:CAMPEP_0204840748 /NCGR_PEP_ID=MMETSP1346-20131115/38897_1 /ASSEMBLY_ACC=CAM_ASM_000771 /TAXON_ID=215587 /ORGANISM="Aplanochytrium stocchinoi, Strain GSBS06" /LENGTH=190 /DNA_ID=CAMNT_0051978351 /DNA_START=32 /DNA_END=600 /DNA_ORIENTATION=+